MIKFVPGATQANIVAIAAALSPVQSVIAADTGHINCHEAASIESTGHKILGLPNTDGKLTSRQIAACAAEYYEGGAPEYLTEPKLVYISFPTEQGTLYSKRELRAISEVCKKYGMYLFVDGARMGYGLGAEDNDLTLKDFAELTDVFYIGGTKCGALFGEALIITEPRLQYRFKAYMKQHGAVLAKGWLMGLQFALMLESGEYFERTKAGRRACHADKAGLCGQGHTLLGGQPHQPAVRHTDPPAKGNAGPGLLLRGGSGHAPGYCRALLHELGNHPSRGRRPARRHSRAVTEDDKSFWGAVWNPAAAAKLQRPYCFHCPFCLRRGTFVGRKYPKAPAFLEESSRRTKG